MVSKTSKNKDKKKARKELAAQLGVAQQLISKANDQTKNHMESLVPFQRFTRNGLELDITCKHYEAITKEEFQCVYDILETNMKAEYEASDWGWNDRDKKIEMQEKDPWFLLATDKDNKIVAFSHFKFDFEDDVEVLYCYEVQVVDEMRGKGIGKFLMQVAELIGARSDMKKVMVTVFKHNPRALHFFYDIMKYKDDDTSPRIFDPVTDENYCYEILSKLFPVKKVTASAS